MAQTYDVKLFQRGGVTMVLYPDGDEAVLADVMRYMNPGMEYDQATGEQMATPPPPAESATYSGSTVRDKPFGSIAGGMAEPYMSQAYDALTRTPVVDPNSYVPQSVQRINQAVGSVGGAGLSGLLGLIYGGAGLVGDVANATGVGGGQRLANDLAGMVDVAGVGPEARMLEMLSNAGAGRSIASNIAERANQRGPVPTMGSNFANLLGDVGEASTGKIVNEKIGNSTVSYQIGDNGVAEIFSVKTPQNKRGQGSAKAAMSDLLSRFDAMGVRDVRLIASPLDNKTSGRKLVDFYKGMGFDLTGERANMAGDPWMSRAGKAKKGKM